MPDPTTLATKIVRALWPSERREQVLDARVEVVRGVLEGEKMETKEPSELARKLSVLARNHLNRIFTLEQGSDRLPQLLADAGLSDLEAKLSERESFLRQCEQLGQQRLSIIIMESGIEEAPYIASVMDSIDSNVDSNEAHVIDLEAKLEAKERELEEMRGRLGEIASKSNPGNFWSDTLGHAKPETVRRIRIHRLATEKEG